MKNLKNTLNILPVLLLLVLLNKTAGTRLRKAFQDIKVLAQEGRNEVTELKNKESK